MDHASISSRDGGRKTLARKPASILNRDSGHVSASKKQRISMSSTRITQQERRKSERAQQELKREQDLKRASELAERQLELSRLGNLKMSLITRMQKEEFKLHILSNEHNDLKSKLAGMDHDISSTIDDRKSYSREYDEIYKLEKQRLFLQHESRLNDLKESVSDQVEKIINKELSATEEAGRVLVEDISRAKQQLNQVKTDLNQQLIKLKETHNKNLISLTITMDENMQMLKQTIDSVQTNTVDKLAKVDQLSSEIEQIDNSKLIRINEQLHKKHKEKANEIEILRSSISSKKGQIEEVHRSNASKAMQIQSLLDKTNQMNELINSQELERRVLHNKLQELKGDIRVFCRIRPSSSEQLASIKVSSDELNDECNQEIVLTREASPFGGSTGNYKFQFDKIFSVQNTNSEIFEELSQLVQSSLDGFNVCVFAYGQTGSGKTYTMSHSETGMIPLSVSKIFDDIEILKRNGWQYNILGQFIEIYNENIIDLLAPNANSAKYEIKHNDAKGTTSITNIMSVDVTSKELAQRLLETASRNRSTAFTRSNERSSRSHSIFILQIHGTNSATGEKLNGTLNLIDLAGSERLTSSQAKGDRLKETQAINKSLSSLGDVIHALGEQQQSHIPYRNSKLTYLLKHSLGGNSKTLMFVNISPLQKNFNETVNSLRFASKVNSTKLKSNGSESQRK